MWKMKWLKWAALVASALLVADVIFWMLWCEQHIQGYASYEQHCQENYPFFGGPILFGVRAFAGHTWRLIDRDHDALLASFTMLLFIVTAALARYTYGLFEETKNLRIGADKVAKQQARDMRRSLAIAKITARSTADAAKASINTVAHMETTAAKELRAYVMVKSVLVKNEVQGAGDHHEPFAWIEMCNFGKVPAKNLVYRVSIASAAIKLLELGLVLTAGKEGPQRIDVIAPGDTFRVRAPIFVLDLDLPKHGHAAYIFGSISYDDGFAEEPRATNFTFMRTGDDWASDGEFDISQHGNECT